MDEQPSTEVCGVRLWLVDQIFRKEGDPDLWAPSSLEWSGPTEARPIHEWPAVIKAYRVATQIDNGFEIWDLKDNRPEYWSKKPAVFRAGGNPDVYNRATAKGVETRNGTDPEGLWRINIAHCAPVTPEVEAAIAEARRLHAEAIEASKRWKEAWKAIPRLSDEDWQKLPPSPRDNQ